MRSSSPDRTPANCRTALLLALVCASPLAAQRPPYQLGQQAQRYFESLFGVSVPMSADGTFLDSVSTSNAASTSGDLFHFDWVYTVCVPNLFGGCIWSHDYNEQVHWDFNVGGPLTYVYQLPFSVTFDFPETVSPGERVYLRPMFTWANPQIRTTQAAEYSHTSSVKFDAPFDGLDEFSAVFTQHSSTADLHLRFPVLPLVPSVPLDLTDIPTPGGGGSWGGSYTYLGGTASLPGVGTTVLYTSPSEITLGGSGCPQATCASVEAWRQGHELFELISTVLQLVPTPVTVAAGTALSVVRTLGDFRLDVYVGGSIAREDYLNAYISDLPYVDVPETAKDFWEFTDLPVTVPYRVIAVSRFWYPLGYRVTFDMLGIDPTQLAGQDLYAFGVGQVRADDQDRIGTFRVSGKVRVVEPAQGRQRLRVDPIHPLGGTAQAREFGRDVPGVRRISVARPMTYQRVRRQSVRIAFPKPAVRTGQPQAGQQTVILGTAPDAQVPGIVANYRGQGIEAFPVAVSDSRDKVITFGSFATERDATLFANMMKEIYGVETAVSPRIEPRFYRPIRAQLAPRVQRRPR